MTNPGGEDAGSVEAGRIATNNAHSEIAQTGSARIVKVAVTGPHSASSKDSIFHHPRRVP